MKRVASLILGSLALVSLAGTALAGRTPEPTPAGADKANITLTVKDFFASVTAYGAPGWVPSFHPVVITSLDGTESWKGETDEAGVVRFSFNSPEMVLTVYCPDGHHHPFTQKLGTPDTSDPIDLEATLKPATRRYLVPTGSPGDRYEPADNTPSGASLLAPGGTQAHNFGPLAGDRDWVKFYAKVGRVYVVETHDLEARSDTVMRVHAAGAGSTLNLVGSSDDDEDGFSSTVSFLAPRTGYHFIELNAFSPDSIPPKSGYLLTVRELAADVDDTPADLASALPLGIGEEIEGLRLLTSFDRDVFSVELEANQTYELETFGLTGPTDTVLELMDASGSLLTSNDDEPFTRASRLVYRVPEGAAGTHYLAASSYSGWAGPSFSYAVRAKAAMTLPVANAGPDQKYCTPASLSVTLDGSGSGNAFGPYVFTTDTASVIDASVMPGATVVANGDDTFTTVALPFPFSYHSNTYASVNVASNGFLTFDTAGATSFTNGAIPSTATPNNAFYGFWDDLNPGAGGDVWVASGTVDGKQAFIAHYKQVVFFSDNSQFVDLNIILFDDGCVEYRYGAGSGAMSTGSSATIGAENATGTLGPQIALNTAGSAAAGVRYRLCAGPATVVPCMSLPPAVTSTCGPIVVPTSALPVTFTSADDGATVVPIGFTYTHFGTNYTNIAIGTNGLLVPSTSPTTAPAGSTSFSNTTLPSTGTPNNTIAAFWDDLHLSTTGTVRRETTGTAPNRVFTVYWSSVKHFPSTTTRTVTFQARLFETTNAIEFCYGPSVGSGTTFNGTIGVENGTGTLGRLVAFSSSAENYPLIGTRHALQPNVIATPGLTYDWDVDGDNDFADGVTGVSPVITVNPNAGATCAEQKVQRVISLRVTDCATGRQATDSMTVYNGDFDKPVITPSYAGPAWMYLWSPNHECVEFSLSDLATVTDGCGGSVSFAIEGVGCEGCYTTQSTEGIGDGNFTPDCCVRDAGCGSDASRSTFTVREERNGGDDQGEDRAYFVNAMAMDSCGNTASMLLGICVVHDSSPSSTAACDFASALTPACPGADNHPNKRCASP
jgi:hypothetical protein